MAEWPSSLPCQPLLDALSFQDEQNFTEFKPDIGRGQRWNRYTHDRTPFEATLHLTLQQVEILRQFHREDCARGVASFTMIDWLSGVSRRFTWNSPPRFDRITGDGFRAALSLVDEGTP